MTLRVLIAVTHLLGAGHLTRAAALARAFGRAGHRTTLVSGGMPAPLVSTEGAALVQLPPVRTAGTDFSTLLDGSGAPAGADRLDARRRMLLAAFGAARPDVVITELFPFGRRVLAAEFAALVEAARARRPRPLIAASVRDILARPKPERVAEAHRRLTDSYDAVLVHGDPNLAPLDLSWPVDETIAPLLHYTGYVDEGGPLESPPGERSGIVVSGGSSAAGLPLYEAALGAARNIPERQWRILVGGGVSPEQFEALRRAAPPHATVERARPGFRALLAHAAVSVSQAGYNTAVDLLRARVPAVLVPFEAGRETEQRLRAESFARLGIARVLPEADLSSEALAAEVRAALEESPDPRPEVDLKGAETSVALVERLARPAAPPRRAAGAACDWSPLDDALRRAADEGVAIPVWWRDDDAVAHTPALDRLFGLSKAFGVPVALAAIPGRIEPSLAQRLAEEPDAAVLVHGMSHANHARAGEKKAEFGPGRPAATLAAEAAAALEAARAALGEKKLVPVFVPPWNRLAPELVARLPALGYRGLSTFGPRPAREPAPGLVQVNTHVDPIDWRGTRGLLAPEVLVRQLAAAVSVCVDGRHNMEPIGLLTHHLIHDEPLWAYCAALLERLARHPNLRYPSVEDLFR
ncbi:MAG TPA: glycosyltransferase [Beijerinckiaceae bacterium]